MLKKEGEYRVCWVRGVGRQCVVGVGGPGGTSEYCIVLVWADGLLVGVGPPEFMGPACDASVVDWSRN